ncbi:uncharacterized protein [Halyomorpha halys]|uniref:uncharacterized protein isoform X2 n=1 Tax=Halyomorpha halys TaxID=286706 RepID=UPI000D0C90B0|nr:uncharacterized protein LOC106678598 isoform X2 [Halyomorpha halys]
MNRNAYFDYRGMERNNAQQGVDSRRRREQEHMDQFFDILVLNDDVLGYKVTLQPELSNAQYVVKFTPIAASQRRSQIYPNQSNLRQETQNRSFGRPTQIRRISGEQVFRRYGQPRRYPIVETILEAVAEASRAERIAQPSSSTEHNNNTQTVCNATVVGSTNNSEARPLETSTRRRRWNGSERRQRRRRRRRGARRHSEARGGQAQESDESMYEVLDVDYEKITDLGKAEPPKDWRIIPKYQLTAKEVAQQEKDLFFSMTRDERPEEPQKAKDGEPGCCVCFENAATRVVIPCGHRCLCHDCAYHIATSRSIFGGKRLPKLCPICQAAIAVIPRLC